MRHQDEHGAWSAWSDSRYFDTRAKSSCDISGALSLLLFPHDPYAARWFSSEQLPSFFSDYSTIRVPIVVNEMAGQISDVDLRFGGGGWGPDCGYTLQHPDGTTAFVQGYFWFGFDWEEGTVFDDQAATIVQRPPSGNLDDSPGTVRPLEPFNAFNGKAPNGTWYLIATDKAGGSDNNAIRILSLRVTTVK